MRITAKCRWPGLICLVAFTLMLSACGDPGSGGSGIPGSSGAPAGNNVSSGLAQAPASQIVEAISATSVTIAAVSYLQSQIDLLAADGSAAPFSALRVGQRVTITQVSADPTPRWRISLPAGG